MDKIVRPPINAFISLIFGYFGQTLSPIIALAIPLIIAPDFTTDIGWEVFLFIVPLYLSILLLWPVGMLQLLFLLVGADFILFRWLDNLIIFFLQYWVSFMTPFIMFTTVGVGISYIVSEDSREEFAVVLAIYAAISYYYLKRTMEKSPDAIRFVDPKWNYVDEGMMLYPFFFYWFGW